MNYAKPTRFTAWSFSRWSDYAPDMGGCPAYAKYKHLDKLPEGPPGPAMARGAAIAKAEEEYVKGIRKDLPPELDFWKSEFLELRNAYKTEGGKTLFVEESWAFTSSWEVTSPTDWNNCQLRVKMDLARFLNLETLLNIDFKTGKYREHQNSDYVLQLELYGIAALRRFPKIKEVHSQLVYTDLNFGYPIDGPMVFTRDQADDLQNAWDERVHAMLSDRVFSPVPGQKCTAFGGCSYSKSKGGPCCY